MSKLSTSERKAMPASEFAGPGRSFPVNDKVHAEKALQLVGRSEKAGNISPSAAAEVRAKARKKLHKEPPLAGGWNNHPPMKPNGAA